MKKILFMFLAFLILLNCFYFKDKFGKSDSKEGVDEYEEFKSIKLKKNIDVSKSTINYFDIESFDNKKFEIKEDNAPFKIVDFGPVDELPVEMKNPTVYLLFSHPVVPLSKLGEVITESRIMSVEPKVAGIFRWYGSKLLSFEPSDKFLPQREYIVKVSSDVKSLGGKKIEGDREFKFHTEYLKVADIHLGAAYTEEGFGEYDDESYDYSYNDIPLDLAKIITVSFSYPVDLNVIKKFIKVISNEKEYDFSISRPKDKNAEENFINRTVILNVNQNFQENTDFSVVILKGAKSEEGFIGTVKEIKKTFHTIKPFKYNSYDIYSYSFPRSDKPDANPVYLSFSHPVDNNSIKNNIKVSIPNISLDDKIEVWGKTVKISNLPVDYESTYRITLNPQVKDIYKRSLNKEQTVDVFVPPASSYYYFPNTGAKFLEAKYQPAMIVFEYQNIFEGVWKVDRIDDPYQFFSNSDLAPYDFSKLKKNTKHYEVVDLTKWLNKSGKGHVGFSWNFGNKNEKGVRPDWYRENLQLQVTDLGVTARYAYNKIIVFVNSLSNGEPVSNARVIISRGHNENKFQDNTDSNGVAVINLKEGDYVSSFSTTDGNDLMRIKVEKDDDKVEFKPNDSQDPYHFGVWSTVWPNYAERQQMHTFIFTDRGLYKPGETVTFRGIDRNLKLGKFNVYEGQYQIEVRDDQGGKPFYTTGGKTTESGGFYGSFKITDNADPGYYTLTYKRDNTLQYTSFQVANFRRLNFSININKPDITNYTGDTITMKVQANYLAGGVLGGGDFDYFWTKNSVFFKPDDARWSGFNFGPGEFDYLSHLSSNKGKLSPNGEVTAKQGTEVGIKGVTYNYTLEARVEDIDRQLVAGRKSAVVHPASFYIGAKLSTGDEGWWSPFVKKGEKTDVEYVIVQPDGKIYESFNKDSKLNLKLYKQDWKVTKQKGVYGRINMRWERVEEMETEQTVALKNFNGKISITPKTCGSYFVLLEAIDRQGRTALTKLYFYSTGAEWVRWRQEDDNDITLVPDKNIYKPKETVKLLVQSPLKEGRYLLTIEREGIFEEKVIDIKGSANTIDIPVRSEYIPIFYVALSSYSNREQDPPKTYLDPDLGKPKGYFGITTIRVDTEEKEIQLSIVPSKKIWRPGEEAEVTITATREGRPVSEAEITFMAADRGVLDLINYHVQNPIEYFYSAENFPLGVRGADNRSLLIDPVTYEIKDLPGGDNEEEKMKTRKDFRPTAVFEPYLKTDKKGSVTVKFKLPDTLTTYRCTAIGVKQEFFGIKENEIMVQNPINVRTALTRRLRVRDTAFAGVIATNLDVKKQKITVSIESDILKIDGETEKEVELPANTSVEIPFTLLALQTGEAKLKFTIKSEVLNEYLEDKIIIEQPIVKEAFSVSGKTKDADTTGINGSAQEGVIIPSNIAEGYGGFTLNIDSTRVGSLSSSIKYLFDYPHGCLEQRAGRLLPLVIFGEKLKAFDIATNITNIRDTIDNEIQYISKYQRRDGGFTFWLDYDGRSDDYCSLKFAHIIYIAGKKGYKIPANLDRTKLLDFISTIQNSKYASLYCKLYSIYIQSLFGRNILVKAEDYLKMEDKLGLSGYGFLGLAFLENSRMDKAQIILSRMKNFIKVGTQSVDLIETYEDRYYFDSGITRLALMLMLYNKIDTQSDFIEKLSFTLLKRQKSGYWGNTSDTTWALLAMSELLEGEAGENTDFTANVKIDNLQILNQNFKGLSKSSIVKNFLFKDEPVNKLEKDKLFQLLFEKNGTGSLFYTATIRYALPSEVVLSRDEGISVFTEILDLNDNKVKPKELMLGETYKMRTIISSTKHRNYLALRVPVPSGAEILDSSFVTTSSFSEKGGTKQNNRDRESVYGDTYTYEDEGYYYYDQDRGYYIYSIGPIQKIMDNEVKYYFDNFHEGKQEMIFLFRITSPGIYPTPPAFAECMYEEEVFGRSSGILYVITEK